jgi:hypothetical protein
MTDKKLVTVKVCNYDKVSIQDNFDPFDIDNPKYQGKITTSQEREWLTNPEHFYFPLLAERQTEIVEVENTDCPSVGYDGKMFRLFTQWVAIILDQAKKESVVLALDSLFDNLIKSAIFQIDKLQKQELEETNIFTSVLRYAISDEELIFTAGNICSIALNEENQQEIQVSLINGAEYFLEGKEATDFLDNIDRSCFLDAKNLLDLYDSELNSFFDFQDKKERKSKPEN